MKAAHHTSYGAPNVLSVTDIDAPALGAGQIRVAVGASAVTQGDRRIRESDFPGIGWLPGRLVAGVFRPRQAVPGTTFAGRVIEVAPDVERFAVGDDVFGICDGGAQAQELVVAADGAVAAMPAGKTYREVAALPYGALTSLVFLRDVAKVQPGERVLVIGASGGVGRYGVQVARHLGAHVTAVCSHGADQLRELGAHEIIDRTTTDYTKVDAEWDVIFDTSRDSRFWSVRRILTQRGRYATVSLTVRILIQMLVTALWRRGRRALFTVALGNQAQMESVAELSELDAVRSPIAHTYTLDQVVDAHSAISFERPLGDVVIEVDAAAGRGVQQALPSAPRLSLLKAA